MQRKGQKQHKRKHLPQAAGHPKREDERDSQRISVQEEQALSAGQQQVEEQALSAEQQKAEEYLNLLRRTQADFVNYRRRMSQEQAEGRLAAQSELLNQLLPVLDDLGRALGATPPDLVKHPWVQGLFLVARRLTTLFEQLGVQQIGTPGEPFDPRWHEALTVEERADVPEGTILQVAQPGYVLGERVIRPAQVIVAGSPPLLSGASTQQEDSEC